MGGEEPPPRDDAVEKEIVDRLAAISPQAVGLFEEATSATRAGELDAARDTYLAVLELAPDFPDVLRRLSYVEGSLGDVYAAEAHAKLACEVHDSPLNRVALAPALLAFDDPARHRNALEYARSASTALPQDPWAQMVLVIAGSANGDADAVRSGTEALLACAPDEPVGHFFAGLVAGEDGNLAKATEELTEAARLGMPLAEVQDALTAIQTAARRRRRLQGALGAVGLWVTSPIILLAVGSLLSRATLTAAYRAPADALKPAHLLERALRLVYRVVITVTSIYFYVSLPFLILIIVGGTLALLYLLFDLSIGSLRLVCIIGVACLFTVISIVRSLFVRLREAEPGRALTRAEAPRLWALAERVAAQLGTRPVDAIYVTPPASMAVTERRRLWSKLRRTAQRCLIFGLEVLPDMSAAQVRSVLAHEYGHFLNRDTAGGTLARRVNISVHAMAQHLGLTGQARWYNPAWLFVLAFNRLFLRITLGASRLQEILADRRAAMAFGVDAFCSALEHTVDQTARFDVQARWEIEDAREEGRPLRNLYTLIAPEDDAREQEMVEAQTEACRRKPSPYASHPAPAERIDLLRSMGAASTRIDPLLGSAWDLFADAGALQAEMTATTQRLHLGDREPRCPDDQGPTDADGIVARAGADAWYLAGEAACRGRLRDRRVPQIGRDALRATPTRAPFGPPVDRARHSSSMPVTCRAGSAPERCRATRRA